MESLRLRARQLKTEVLALYLAYRDPRVSWYARIFAALVVGYALSPIDLIPDFIPVLGYLDDLILVPLGIWLAIKMIPRPVMDECRVQAQVLVAQKRPQSWVAAGVVVVIWLLLAAMTVTWVVRLID